MLNVINKAMKILKMNSFLAMGALFFLFSCGDLSQEAEKRLNELREKTAALDTLINKEVDKVLALDSLIDSEKGKVKELDSLVKKAGTKLDSISQKLYKNLKN